MTIPLYHKKEDRKGPLLLEMHFRHQADLVPSLYLKIIFTRMMLWNYFSQFDHEESVVKADGSYLRIVGERPLSGKGPLGQSFVDKFSIIF